MLFSYRKTMVVSQGLLQKEDALARKRSYGVEVQRVCERKFATDQTERYSKVNQKQQSIHL